MADLMTATYYVTRDKVQEGQHILHSSNCQVIPEDGLEELGEHENCPPAMEMARQRYEPVNGCAFCSPECYTGSEAFEKGEGLLAG